MNRENLLKLAEGLEGPLRAEFDMGQFSTSATAEPLNSCGTAGCAVGHATYLVDPRLEGEGWFAYSERVFDVPAFGRAWTWLFDDTWGNVDNTPQGAPARIRYLLEHGKPPKDWQQQLSGKVPLCYTTEAQPTTLGGR